MSAPTGYTTIGTILQIDGSPFAAALAIGYPELSMGVLETTNLKPTNGYKTKIPDGLIDVKSIDIQGITTPGALDAMKALLDAREILPFEIDFTDGDAMTFDGFITALKPGSASEKSPATETFTISIQPTGEVEFASGATGHWYDNVTGLAVVGGDQVVSASPVTLQVMAVCGESGFAFPAPNADLDFTSSAPSLKSVGSHTGLVTNLGDGPAVITVKITGVALQTEITVDDE